MEIKVLKVVSGGMKNDGITTMEITYYKALMDAGILNELRMDYVAINEISSDETINKFIDMGAKIHYMPNRQKKMFSYFVSIYKLLKQEKYDVIHVQGSSALLCVELLAAKMAKVRVRIANSRNTKCLHKLLDSILRPLFNRLYTDAFACGMDAGRWLFGKRPFFILPNGKDLSKFVYSDETRNAIREELGIQDKIVIGHVGNLIEQKNHKFLLRVFAEFRKKEPNSVLYMMGEGKLRNELEQLSIELGIQNDVVFAGRVYDVHVKLQAMDIMIFPSLFEGLPNVVLEWQAEGLPCLMSDVITKECIVADFVHTMSLDENECVWANKIKEILSASFDREKESVKAIQLLKQTGYDINDNARMLFDKYVELVDLRQ